MHAYICILCCYIVGSLSLSPSLTLSLSLSGVLSLREPLKAAKWAAAIREAGLDPTPGMLGTHMIMMPATSQLVYLYVFLAVPVCYRRL